MNFECHVTCEVKDVVAAKLDKPPTWAAFGVWKTSQIDRDPVLGEKVYFYYTCHDTDMLSIHARMKALVLMLSSAGVPVIREKIELIMYDTKGKS